MSTYKLPELKMPEPVGEKEVILVASGDLRLAANQTCWAAQEDMERRVSEAFAREGYTVRRGHAYDPVEKHGFISSQRMGMDVFQNIHPDARVVVAESVWQYSYHVLAGLRKHRGPILTLANWSGEFPGLVGMLNLNGSLTKMGVRYSTLWSVDFTDEFFINGLRQWLREGHITHDASHVRDLNPTRLPAAEAALGRALAAQLQHDHAIIGIFDEGCMGMYNAIIDDELLNPLGIYKERLSQSALVAAMQQQVADSEARAVLDWLLARGMRFEFGTDEATELTEAQVLEQCKMYIAALRIAHAFGCDAIGIQYQQGLKDMVPASDLAEGLLNNAERPPVYDPATGAELYPGRPLTHFNEVDEGAAVDGLVTHRVWSALGLDPANTLHDVRWGEWFTGNGIDDFVWVFEISGAVPPSHFARGYADAVSIRQPPMFFRKGGGTISGLSKPGEVVWSRVYVMDNALHVDMGRLTAVSLPREEAERRWQATNPQWPMMFGVLHGVTRDQLMGRHKANHIHVAYAPDAATADLALAAKAAMFDALGVKVHLCGTVNVG